MKRARREGGYSLIDVLMGLALFSFLLLAVFRLFGVTIALSRDAGVRLAGQQDVRLALDRVARALHETTTAYGRFKVYAPQDGCSGQYEGCLAFVSARDAQCTGTFQLVDGGPNWQASLYLWRDVTSNELRMRCDTSTTFPPASWPPKTLAPYVVVGTHIVGVSVSRQPAASLRPSAVAIAIREQADGSGTARRPAFFNETVFLPQHR